MPSPGFWFGLGRFLKDSALAPPALGAPERAEGLRGAPTCAHVSRAAQVRANTAEWVSTSHWATARGSVQSRVDPSCARCSEAGLSYSHSPLLQRGSRRREASGRASYLRQTREERRQRRQFGLPPARAAKAPRKVALLGSRIPSLDPCVVANPKPTTSFRSVMRVAERWQVLAAATETGIGPDWFR